MSFFFNPDEFTGKKTIRNSFLADPCKICGLYKNCESPKIEPFGDNKKNILALGEAPGEKEDEEGIGFVGKSGDYLKLTLSDLNIHFEKDCTRSNVIQCHPQDNIFLPDKVIYCYSRLEEQIKECKPKLILCFGMEAIKRILETDIIPSKLEDMHGMVFPSRKYKCWVSCNYHPAYILRKKGGDRVFKGQPEFEDIFRDDIEKALGYLETNFVLEKVLSSNEMILLNSKEAIILLEEKINSSENCTCTVDFETNRLSPFFEDSKIICMGLNFDSDIQYVIPLEKKNEKLNSLIHDFFESGINFTNHNLKFESIWAKQFFDSFIVNQKWDTMLAAHVLDERPNIKSLGFQTFLHTGIEYKEMIDRKNIENADRPTLWKYNASDIKYTRLISNIQKK